MTKTRTNPDHKWLEDRGWIKVNQIRFGNRVQQQWAHPRNGDINNSTLWWNTSMAQYCEMRHQRRIDLAKGDK